MAGYVTRSTAFVTVAVFASSRPEPPSTPRGSDIGMAPEAADPPLEGLLTERELEVFALMAESATNAEIADLLYIAQEHRPDARQEHPAQAWREEPYRGRGPVSAPLAGNFTPLSDGAPGRGWEYSRNA
jgi:hypothetical protein